MIYSSDTLLQFGCSSLDSFAHSMSFTKYHGCRPELSWGSPHMLISCHFSIVVVRIYNLVFDDRLYYFTYTTEVSDTAWQFKLRFWSPLYKSELHWLTSVLWNSCSWRKDIRNRRFANGSANSSAHFVENRWCMLSGPGALFGCKSNKFLVNQLRLQYLPLAYSYRMLVAA